MNMKVKIAIAAVIVVALVALIFVDQKTSQKKPNPQPSNANAPRENGSLFAKKTEPKIPKDASEEGEITIRGKTSETPRVEPKEIPIKGTETGKTDAIKPEEVADPSFEEYVIKAGDMYTTIAAKTYGDENLWKVIADANPEVKPASMKVGKKIRIPVKPTVKSETVVETGTNGKVYVVQPGDTLGGISKKVFQTSRYAEQIFEANRDKLESPDDIKVGMKLALPEIAPKKETVAPETEMLAGGKTHKVSPREALWNIAEQYRGERGVLEMIDMIVRANPGKLRDANTTLRVGWVLAIPE